LIARFILSLRIQWPFGVSTMSKIQAVTLLPSHLDKQGDQPRCKGFALIVLSDIADVDTLLTEWPWKRIEVQGENSLDSEARQEALKYGLKTLSKRRWEELQEEYLAYRQKLLAVDNPVLNTPHVAEHSQASGRKRSVSPSRNEPTTAVMSVSQDLISPSYPTGCLVFVRNVQPETNKTTLRTLFAAAFQAGPVGDQSPIDGLDYVDFTKGMDSVRHTIHKNEVIFDNSLFFPVSYSVEDAWTCTNPG
jgi:2-phospho-L-lactate guanylyltransferase (CobY/MobA/RfbA family)